MTAAAIAKHEVHDRTTTIEEPSATERPTVLSFPPFGLDFVEERLWKGNLELRLRAKPFAILRYLAQNPRRLVTRAEIVDAVWGGRVAMSESLLRTHMHDLRRALGESVVETVVGRGYRFVANVGDVGARRRLDVDGAVATALTAARTVEFVGDRHLELVRYPAGAGVGEIRDVTGTVVSAAHARVARQLADMVAASGTAAVVVLVVAEATVSHEAHEQAATA